MAHPDHIDECSKIFVSWAWLAGIIATLVVGACALVYGYSEEQHSQNIRIEKLESMHNDIDTIKTLLRNIER